MLVMSSWAPHRGRSALAALLLGALALLGAAEGYTEEMLLQGIDSAALVRTQPASSGGAAPRRLSSTCARLPACCLQQQIQWNCLPRVSTQMSIVHAMGAAGAF